MPVVALLALCAGSVSGQVRTPFIFSLSPPATAGFPTFTLTVGGSSFGTGDVVVWTPAVGAPTNLPTAAFNPNSPNQLTATVDAALIATAGSVNITVLTLGNATSNALSYPISKNGTSGTLTTSPVGAANLGQSVTLTATFTPFSPGTGTPTGAVAFVDNSTIPATALGSANLSSGVATLTTSAIPLGFNSLTAVWPGDNNFFSPDGTPTSSLTVINVTLAVSTNSIAMAAGASGTVTYTTTVDLAGTTGPVGPVTIQDGLTPITGTGTDGSCLPGGNSPNPLTGLITCTVIYDGADGDRDVRVHSMTAAYTFGNTVVTSNPQSVTVTAATPLIVAPVSSVGSPVSGQSTTISVGLTGLAPPTAFNALTGTVSFFDGVTLLNATPIGLNPLGNNGFSAALPARSFSAGAHSITARYNGSAIYLATTSPALSLQVGQAGTNTTLSAATSSTPFGIADVLTATVSVTSPGTGTPTGTVSFRNNGVQFGTGTLTNGTATYTLTTALPPAVYSNITAVYSGDANDITSTSSAIALTVTRNGTTGALAANPVGPSPWGTSETLTASITPANGGVGTPTGTVTFTDGNVNLGSAPLISGVASFATSAITPGNKTLSATYSGDANFNPPATAPTTTLTVTFVSPTVTVVPNPATVTVGNGVASTVTYTVTVVGGPSPPIGTITLFDTSHLPLTAVGAGPGTCPGGFTLTQLDTVNTSTGSCTIGYDGSNVDRIVGIHPMVAHYVPSGASAVGMNITDSAAHPVTVTVATPTIGTPAATPAGPLISGQPTVISVAVQGLSPNTTFTTLTGSVIFFDGSTQLNSTPITLTANSGNGATASLPARGFSAGLHNITAQYSGSPSYSSATSAALSLPVGRANTTTSLTVASPSFIFGIGDLLTATVAVTSPGAGTPTGTVSFRNGSQTIGTGVLIGGVATYFLTTALPPNPYSITAVYNGDGSNNSSMSAASAITVLPVPTIDITNAPVLPPGTVGVGYLLSFGASGATGNINWTLTGGSLPGGLGLSSAGVLRGTPTTPGTYSFSVTATDSNGVTGNASFTLVINAPTLVVTGDNPAVTTVGASFSFGFGATGGVQPYQFSVSGTLPPGTSVSGNTISGTINGSGTFGFTITVTDHAGTVASRNFSVTVTPKLTVTGTLPDGQVGVAYSAAVGASGGTQPYRFSGTAPAGLTVASDGSVTGTPNAPGPFTVSVTVTDAAGATAVGSVSINIIPAPLTISTTSLPDGTVGRPYSASVAAAGGVKPYTFTIGGLPDGVTAGADGSIAGTPTTAGPFTVTATVKDAAGKTATATFNATIASAPLVLTLSAGNGTVGSAYSASASATGGVKPYTFSASGLPAGVSLDSGTGAISGTPLAGGTTTISVTVTDHAGKTATQTAQVTISLPPPPPVTFTGVSGTGTPGGQQTVGINIANPYPVDMSVILTLTFAPDAGGDDQTIVFATGGRTARLTIPAGGTVSLSNVGVQTGTVAGLITITAQLAVSNTDITPSPAPSRTIRIAAAAAVITTATATRNTNGFTVAITGFVTDREITSAIFTFTAAAGATLQTTSITVPVDSLFSAWFSGSASNAFGSQFSFTQPFSVQGSATSIVSVTITLVNKVGSSTAVTATLQ